MLMTVKDMELYKKYLTGIKGTNMYHCKNPKDVPKSARKQLLEHDTTRFEVYGEHLIDNYEELR